jgi:hypothetical protein
MTPKKSVLVFCGSQTGTNPLYAEAAAQLGKMIAEKGAAMIYGSGSVGLMGISARSAIAHGAEVTGIIPWFLQKLEGGVSNLTKELVVSSMHERKIRMAEMSDGVFVLPGAYGTLDELFEMLTLQQLKQINQPIAVYNINGFYDHLLRHVDRMKEEGFLQEVNKNIIRSSDNMEELLDYILDYPAHEGIDKPLTWL